MLIVDEFGKTLEAANTTTDSDPFILQQLAEIGRSPRTPILLITLQHQSFAEYLPAGETPLRREWAKVQGRFTDVTYTDSATASRSLIASAFTLSDDLRRRVEQWAHQQTRTWRQLSVAELADPGIVAACYPLDPLTALTAAELSNRYAQHERTLFSFLATPEEHTVASFVEAATVADDLPTVGVEAVYDYFVGGGAAYPSAMPAALRWAEVASRIADTHGLDATQNRIAKTVATLNLIATGGNLRASPAIIKHHTGATQQQLDKLVASGLMTYRRFADEYRIWSGTDTDIDAALATASASAQHISPAELLAATEPLTGAVAARHSAEQDTFRVFERRYADATTSAAPVDATSPYDGLVMLRLTGTPPEPQLAPPGAKPVVVATPADPSHLLAAAREVATVAAAATDPAVAGDWVARRELADRHATATAALRDAAAETYNTTTCRWEMLTAAGPVPLRRTAGTAPLSEAADAAFPNTPPIRNEMLNRTTVTSQAARARRILMTAMIEHPTEERLGLTGAGPDMAMYDAALGSVGIHDPQRHPGGFGAPAEPRLAATWSTIIGALDGATDTRVSIGDIAATLRNPPTGVKAAALPIFLLAALIARNATVAVYEHGTFLPHITVEVAERMLRNPAQFEATTVTATSGARRDVTELLAGAVNATAPRPGTHIPGVVAVVARLVAHARRLPNHTLRTTTLPAPTRKGRDALLAATDPGELLFTALPAAFGLPAVAAAATSYPEARRYAHALKATIEQLSGHMDATVDNIAATLLAASGHASRETIARDAAGLLATDLQPDMRALLGALAATNGTQRQWAATIATVLARKAPTEWTRQRHSGVHHHRATTHRNVRTAPHAASNRGPPSQHRQGHRHTRRRR